MKLHIDKDAFEAITIEISNITNYRQDIIEKDYYVTLLLKELADKQGKS